jgi:hypothetical protein
MVYLLTIRKADKKRGCIAVFNACAIVKKWGPLGDDSPWGDVLLRQWFAQDQYDLFQQEVVVE